MTNRMPKPKFKKSSQQELQAHHKNCFERVVTDATRQQFSIFNPELGYWQIGCPDEWKGPNGFEVFKQQFRRKPPTTSHEFKRISDGSSYCSVNLMIGLTREAKDKVIGLVQTEMDRTGEDLNLMLEGLNKANCPSDTTANMTEFQLEHFVRDNRIKPTGKKRL